jgi:hypothetical protein
MDVNAPEVEPAEDDEAQCSASFVAEADELHSLVQRIRDTQGAPNAGAYARVVAIVRAPVCRRDGETRADASVLCLSTPCS